MQDDMRDAFFEAFSDDDLHAAVRRLTARSNIDLADLLVYLGEVEARGIHRSRACASLFTYCQYELRMSEDAAYRRSKAARLVHRHPELRDIVARGEIHLTGLLMIAPLLGGERHAEVLARARFRSKREIARLMAGLDPKPEVPAMIEPIAPARSHLRAGAIAEAFVGHVRNLPTGDRPADWIEPPPEGVVEVVADAARTDATVQIVEHELAEAERSLEGAWQAARSTQPERPLRFKVQFTASQEYVDLLEEAIDLLGFRKKTTSLPEVQLRALRELVERLRKHKRKASAQPASTNGVEAPAAPARMPSATDSARLPSAAPERRVRGRHVPVGISRAVWTRDGSRCAYTDDRGRRCAETFGLELHHREAFARGGPSTEENLELRCRAHNTLAAEADFGREHMDFVRGRETRCPTPHSASDRSGQKATLRG